MNIHIKSYEELTKDELFTLLRVRVDVFVVEQQCPYPEIDDIDKACIHIFLEEENNIFAYLRLFEKDENYVQLGRVLTTVRNKGYGLILMNKAIEVAKDKYPNHKIYIEAQEYAIGFYERFHFKVASEVFLEDGIPHVKMIRE